MDLSFRSSARPTTSSACDSRSASSSPRYTVVSGEKRRPLGSPDEIPIGLPLQETATVKITFMGKVIPENMKHFFALYHVKSEKKTDSDALLPKAVRGVFLSPFLSMTQDCSSRQVQVV